MGAMTVLVVEDDDAVRTLITATLPERWALLEATDGMEAIATARLHRPNAILLDHDLPMLEGAEVCRVLRREPWCQRTRIIALTASSDATVRGAFAEAGVDAFLNKPFSPVQLLDLLDAWEREVV